MTSRETNKKRNFWTKTVNFFKSPFQRKRKDEELTDSEDYDSSSEESYSSDYSSEEDLDYLDTQKDRIAFTSSQARFVTPENRPTNLRYQLRQNPRPSLRAQEAQAQALVETRAKDRPKTTRQPKKNITKPKKIKISVPSAEPTAPPLDHSPILPPYEENRPASQPLDSWEEESVDQIVQEILQASGIQPKQFPHNPPPEKTSGFIGLYDRAVELLETQGLNIEAAAKKALKEFNDRWNALLHAGLIENEIDTVPQEAHDIDSLLISSRPSVQEPGEGATPATPIHSTPRPLPPLYQPQTNNPTQEDEPDEPIRPPQPRDPRQTLLHLRQLQQQRNERVDPTGPHLVNPHYHTQETPNQINVALLRYIVQLTQTTPRNPPQRTHLHRIYNAPIIQNTITNTPFNNQEAQTPSQPKRVVIQPSGRREETQRPTATTHSTHKHPRTST